MIGGVIMGSMDLVKWEQKFAIAEEYYYEFGHLNVPDKYVYGGIILGNWIYLQRKNYRENKLSQEQIDRLNAMHMVWDVIEENWEKMFCEAQKYYANFGNLLVPISYHYDDIYLGKWISHQRQSYAKGKLPASKIERLEALGMVWDASNSNIASSFPEQAIFFYLSKIFPDAINRCTDYGCEIDIYIPSLMVGIEYDGFAWHQNKKKDIEKNKFLHDQGIQVIRVRESGCPELLIPAYCRVYEVNRSYTNLPDVLKKLIGDLSDAQNLDVDLVRDQIAITENYINIYRTQWETKYKEAKTVFLQTGSLKVIDDKKLKSWLSHQRQRYKQNKVALTADQIRKLEEIGMVWEPHKAAWDEMYSLACLYYREHGNINIAADEQYANVKLGSWISSQRSKYKQGKLSEKRVNKLNELGMIWDAKVDSDKCWEDRFAEAASYYQNHGNLRVVLRDSSLGRWINTQRTFYAKGELCQERVDRLNEIGMIWDVFDEDWERMYNLAVQYHLENGHIHTSSKEVYRGYNLGMWIKRQCDGKEGLSTQQTQKLERLGIVWKRNKTKWDKMYALACEYQREYGDLLVNTHADYRGEKLGMWINRQRSDYMLRGTEKENTDFTEERISALEAIGMVWDVHKFKWDRMYEIAKRYYLYFGHLNVKHTEEFENVKLGSWIVNQRSAYRKQSGRKPLSEEQIEALNKIGMKW